MTGPRDIRIEVPVLARVEGEASLSIRARDGRIEDLQLRIFEPPRLFEKLLEGRDGFEVPDMVARICGICPVAYQMSAVQALESLYRVDPGPWVRDQRRAMYCGEWLQSHSLHIHLLALPDFLGFESVIDMAQRHPEIVRRGLLLQALGNDLIRLYGGRSVHPVGVRIGGFHRAPDPADVAALLERLRAALPEAEQLVTWLATLPLPDDAQTFTSVALRHPRDYPMNDGRLVSDHGLDLAIDDYETRFAESQREHSTALYSHLDGQPYLVGPLARLNLNHDRLPPLVQDLLQSIPVRFPSRNMFHSAVARALEILVALHEAIRILSDYRRPERPAVDFTPVAGTGACGTEAPRGVLWHRYIMNVDGTVRTARIVPPTSQNQARMEQDLRQSLETFGLGHDDAELRRRGEMVIRNYDPCISCATHFLDLRVRQTWPRPASASSASGRRRVTIGSAGSWPSACEPPKHSRRGASGFPFRCTIIRGRRCCRCGAAAGR
jgi:coenzyme F420-reducing hydrogenase alpha subunit